jgi:hypothetical protein
LKLTAEEIELRTRRIICDSMALADHITAVEKERDALKIYVTGVQIGADELVAENIQLTQERDQAREALRAVEFNVLSGRCVTMSDHKLPWCGATLNFPQHEPDCIVGKALKESE